MTQNAPAVKKKSWIDKQISSVFYWYFISVIVLLVVLYQIWPLPFQLFSQKVLMPAVQVLSDLGYKATYPVRIIKDVANLDKENKRLENENRQLRGELVYAQEALKSATLLSEEIAKNNKFPEAIQARVVGRTPGGLSSTVLIDKGSDSSVQKGQAVLSLGYFVGKVDKVSERTSEVRLIFSHDSLVPVVMTKNSEGGILQGGLEGLMVTDIPISSKTEPGDEVVTSGLGGDLPRGLLVGTLGAHLGMQGDLFQKVRIISPINPYKINYVSILQ